MSEYFQDTITALATASGRSGVGIIRISGSKSLDIVQKIIHFIPKNRHAHYCDFFDQNGLKLDQGIVLFFKGPHSFTGEDIVEFQAHGGPVVLDLLIKTVLAFGGGIAEAGEFSQRAFRNDKLDLLQGDYA